MLETKRQQAIRDYFSAFGRNFPLFLAMGMDDEEIIETIRGCIREKKLYDPKNRRHLFVRA